MAAPGVGVLIDTDRLKDPSKQATPYFIQVDANRYYGKTPESAVKEAKKAFNTKSSTNIVPRKSKKQKQTSVTDPMEADLKLLGVSSGATASEIKAAWKKLALAEHPNMGGTGANQNALKMARDRLLSRLKATPAAKASAEPVAVAEPVAAAAAEPAAEPATAAETATEPAAEPAAEPEAEPAAATGGGKMRNSLKRRRTFRKKRSTTRKHLKRY
jgi:hypothetical protein